MTAPSSFQYKWQLSNDGLTGWSDISLSATFTPTLPQVGKYARAGVAATNIFGTSAYVFSAVVGPINPLISYMLREDGSYLLREDGGRIIREDS